MNEIRDRVEDSINTVLIDLLKRWGNDSTQVLIPEARRGILAIPEIAQGLEAVEKGYSAKIDSGERHSLFCSWKFERGER